MLYQRSMPNKTITKFSVFVIFAAFLSTGTGACHNSVIGGGEPPSVDGTKSPYDGPKVIGKIESDEITESSGIAASRCQQGVIWTHNDSGDGAFIYAVNAGGRHLGTWQIPNARNIDWEDIAGFKDGEGKCYLYIGEIGNNNNERAEHKIYRVAEPAVHASDSNSTRKEPIQTEPAEILTFSYPDARQDAETLMVHPKNGEIYVLTKHRSGPSAVYKLKPVFDTSVVVKAEKVSDITVPAIPNGLLTGGDIAPDGSHVILCDYFAGYELVLPDGASNFDEIWKQKPTVVELGDRKQGEAVSYAADGLSILATSEGKSPPLIEAKRLKQP